MPYNKRDSDKMLFMFVIAFGIISALYLIGYALIEATKILGI